MKIIFINLIVSDVNIYDHKIPFITIICIMKKYKRIVLDYCGIDQATISNRTTLLFERFHDLNSNVTQLSWLTLVKIKTTLYDILLSTIDSNSHHENK